MGRRAAFHTGNVTLLLYIVYKIKLLNLRIIREAQNWESLAQSRKIARMCALYKAYTGDSAWKAMGDRLQAPRYLSKVYHHWKIRARKQRTDIGKYSFVDRSITDRNQLPEGVIRTSHGKTHILKRG